MLFIKNEIEISNNKEETIKFKEDLTKKIKDKDLEINRMKQELLYLRNKPLPVPIQSKDLKVVSKVTPQKQVSPVKKSNKSIPVKEKNSENKQIKEIDESIDESKKKSSEPNSPKITIPVKTQKISSEARKIK